MTLFEMYIDGKWVKGSETKDVISPIDGAKLGELSMGTADEVDKAVDAAKKAQRQLEKMTVFERAQMLHKIADAIMNRHEEIANLLAWEHGKPIGEARGEVAGSANAFRECAEQIKWMDGIIIPVREGNKRCLVIKKPIGVFGIITPWNYPIGTACMYYLAPGLAAGCPIVWNPATSTAAVASVFARCFEDAQIPAGFINLVIGSGGVVGDAIVTHPLVAGIGFTGSTEVGNIICSRAGAKHTQMELGGNGPSIVLKDADLELTADKIMNGSFSNAGQICTATGRVLVDDSIADKLIEICMSKIGKYKLGDPFDDQTTIGPMHTKGTIDVVLKHIKDGVDRGAVVLVGGGYLQGRPTDHYVEPTIIDKVSPESLLNTDETFGPVLPFIRFKDECEIPGLVEMSPYRLFAAVFTRDIDKAMTMAESYNFGSWHINEGSNMWDTMMPAGGGGGSDSGFGRSGGKYSINDFSEERALVINLQTT